MSTARPFYFAWVNAGTAFNPAVHNVEDEQIVSFRVEQIETEFATMTMLVKNPRIGLLNAGRKLCAWLSWFDGVDIQPLFFGRLIGIPSNLHLETVELQFVARPTDFADQKEALADTMRVLPYFDPVFISEEAAEDPDTVLEARTQVWHIDRTSHVVTTSDLLVGEDGVLEFLESDVVYSNVEISFEQPPVRKVRVEASVNWTQAHSGTNLIVLKNWLFETVAGSGLIGGWPAPGSDLGGGWSVFSSAARSPYTDLEDEDFAAWFQRNIIGQNPAAPVNPVDPPPFFVNFISSSSQSVSGDPFKGTQKRSSSSTYFAIIADKVFLDLSLSYNASRGRKDTVIFNLVADTQPVVVDPEDEDVLELSLQGNDVGQPLPVTSEIAIGSVTRRSYFTQARGILSLEYLIQLARANIIIRSRAVRVSFKCKFERAIEFSLRKNALLHDNRIPGGQAVGKIVGYSFWSEAGEIAGQCTIAAAIGYGGSISALPGTPSYVEEGYVEEGYQVYTGQTQVIDAGDTSFEYLIEVPNDDGLVFPLRAAAIAPTGQINNVETATVPLVTSEEPITGTQTVQIDDNGNTTSFSTNSTVDTGPWEDWLGGFEARVEFQLKSVIDAQFESVYLLSVSELKIPQQINLEADAT